MKTTTNTTITAKDMTFEGMAPNVSRSSVHKDKEAEWGFVYGVKRQDRIKKQEEQSSKVMSNFTGSKMVRKVAGASLAATIAFSGTNVAKADADSTYVVGAGDTIESIAEKHFIEPWQLIDGNDFENHPFKDGAEIRVPDVKNPYNKKMVEDYKAKYPEKFKEQQPVAPKQEVKPQVKEQQPVAPKQEVKPQVKEQQPVAPKQEVKPQVKEQQPVAPKQEVKPQVKEQQVVKQVNNVKPVNNANKVVNKNTYNNEIVVDYVVKKGDNLWRIARKYSTTVEELRSANGISTNNLIYPNQHLKINVGFEGKDVAVAKVSKVLDNNQVQFKTSNGNYLLLEVPNKDAVQELQNLKGVDLNIVYNDSEISKVLYKFTK
ncbi:LysM peptidoglycan-binding domain-containing protein [Bacillus bombysepticus]|uniref:LysM peptidoglycan-binding domain-containing protein n=1 Tax=Bacillus bombysepticus TaxID=658666 RepID=UPI00301AA2BA